MDRIDRIVNVSLSIAAVVVLAVGCATPPEPPVVAEESEQVLAIGDTGPAGGIVFYVDRRNEFEWTYLEAAPEGWHDGDEDPAAPWGPMGVLVGADGNDVGTGASNTALIAEVSDEHAAHLASIAVINGFDDWFVPSNQELHLLYDNLFRQRVGGLSRESYWSSTERTGDRAMVLNFDIGGAISGSKVHDNRIRPIRAF